MSLRIAITRPAGTSIINESSFASHVAHNREDSFENGLFAEFRPHHTHQYMPQR
ncbi:MAG: hypothetical protein ACYDCC_00335 [Actinomycetota bacterium]